ncbi:MAG: T9SS type A sorting domain-containing protein [Flavobacteriales bacterium]|nr:T9SS type A sorting domain-containing protein [Flavobacteriales bacterium]
MKLKLPPKVAALALMAGLAASTASAQCTNTSSYGSATPDAFGGLTTISTCSYLMEYSTVYSVVAGSNYEFTVTGGGYITVHEGTYNGPVIAQGYSPLVATATVDGTLYPHWNTNDLCGTSTGCQTTTVQLLLNCVPPTATITPVDDCDNNQFSLTVNVTSIGDGTDVDLVYNVNGGANDTLFDQPVGSYVIGPFTVGETVNLVLVHSGDPMCNRNYPGLISANTCPTIIACGGEPVDGTYCYVNNDNNHWHYQSDNGMPLIIIFSSGGIESANYDHIRIYDGPDNSGILLYENPVGSSTDLAGLQFTAASGHLYMEVTSESSVSCATNTAWTWNWQVGCLDCNPAVVDYTVNTDCDAQEFTIDVNVTTLGSDPTLDITNNAGAPTVTAEDIGVYTVGPFPITTEVTLTMVNDNNSLCNVVSPVLTNPLCPTHVTCGEPALQETYCYTNSDIHAWHWQNTDPGGTLAMRFSAGTVDWPGLFGDNIRIYDGADNTAPLLYQNITEVILDDMMFFSTGDHLYMELNTSTFGSCQDGFETEWQWEVGCYDCAPPEATYTVNTDCDAQNFTIDVDITNMGSQALLDITNDAGAPVVPVTATGVYTVGPFPITTEVVITLENDTNSLCNVHSETLTNPLCPSFVTCGGAPLEFTYCYPNNDFHQWHWQSGTDGLPLIIIFSAGSIESATWDHIRIYDGPDNTGTLLYENPVGSTIDLTGMQFVGASGHIYMENTSEGSVSCGSGSMTEWAWQVGCLDCVPAVATYSVVTDCDAMQFNVEVNITELGSDAVLDITNNGGALPVAATATGVYSVGPFTAGTPVVITLVNDQNALCNVSSNPLVNPLCPTIIECGGATLADTYCYGSSENMTWHWQASTATPLAMHFNAGTIESNFWDNLTIYDGPDALGTIIFANGDSQTILDDTTLIASSGHIYMTFTSDFSGSCADGLQTAWDYEISCLDCTNPAADFSLVEDCIHHNYTVAVNVTDLGSGAFARIANSMSTDTLTNIPAGITMVGPFPMDSAVVITVLSETNNLCRINSPVLNSNSLACVDTVCAAAGYEYCYANNDTAWFPYQGLDGVPLTVEFHSGSMLPGDFVQIYNGLAPVQANQLWQGNLNGNLAGWAVNTTNGYSTMLVRVVSNASGSCATGEAATLMTWTVQCGMVGVDEAGAKQFAMYPNPTTGQLVLQLPESVRGLADMRVTDLAGRLVHQEVFSNNGSSRTIDLKGLQSGNYMVTITTNDWVKAQQLQIIR